MKNSEGCTNSTFIYIGQMDFGRSRLIFIHYEMACWLNEMKQYFQDKVQIKQI